MIANRKEITGTPQRTEAGPLCPECGGSMKVADLSRENGVQFTWYVCGRENCGGQWLEKDTVVPHLEKWRRYRQAASRTQGPQQRF